MIGDALEGAVVSSGAARKYISATIVVVRASHASGAASIPRRRRSSPEVPAHLSSDRDNYHRRRAPR
jgi:hypothetical protein